MVHDGCCTPERYEFEVCPCTEHLCLVDGTLHHSRLTLNLVDDQVGLVDNAIQTRVEALYHAVVCVEGVLVEHLHAGVVTTRTATTPDVVGEQVLGEEPVEVVAAHLQV